jgi:hypothetical protein
MKLCRLIPFIVCLFFIISKTVPAQDLETRLQKLIESNKIQELRDNLELIKRKYKDSPIPFYADAFIERDADKAIVKYRSFIDRFPNSHFVANAKYKIAQYNYAKGLYHTARELLSDFSYTSSNSPYVDDAYYLMIRCLIALELNSRAEEEIKFFTKKFPKSPFKKLAQQELKQLKNKKSSRNERRYTDRYSRPQLNIHRKYTIQVAAFRDQNNAIKQMEEIAGWGYPVEITTKIVDQNLFYLVWVGDFETDEEALNFGQNLKKKYGLSFRVVRKEHVEND